MKKIKVLLKAPVLTQSGYGVHSRQIFDALFNDEMFDVHVEAINWGHTPFLTESTKQKENILECIKKYMATVQTKQNQFDLFVHVTVPNEFERKGYFNIGVTAGIETDRCSHVWIQKCNEMDLIVVPSEHSKKVFEDTTIEWENPQTQKRGEFKLDKPIVVCSEGVNVEIFKKLDLLPENKIKKMKFDANFNFLHVGQWGNGGFGEDRKNIAYLVRYFIETFYKRKDVGLILKLNMARNNTMDYENVLGRLRQIKANYPKENVPPIHLIHGGLTDEEMATLYNHPQVKSFVSLTHGEGFGLPLLEAAACDLPVLATKWSGHMDFLSKGKFSGIEFDMKEIPDVVIWDPILIKGAQWAEVREKDTKQRLKKMADAYSLPAKWARELGSIIREEFATDVVQESFIDVVKVAMKQPGTTGVSPEVQSDPLEHLESFVDTPEDYNLLFTMPRSTGDVFIATAVLDGVMKEVPAGTKVYFATQPQYFDLLKDNPNIHKVIPWNQSMMQVDITEKVFDLVLTPDVATQYVFSNWTRRGQGRLLAEEYANHCNAELGEYYIGREDIEIEEDLSEGYITFHPGSGEGQWGSRRYDDWKEVLVNIKGYFPNLKIVQIGGTDEPLADETDVDLRGKTSYQQLATVIEGASMHLSIDTFTMHVAAALDTPLVALFGCSYATATGPWVKDKKTAQFILLQSERITGCKDKACYKDNCVVNPEFPPINEIDPVQIVESCVALLYKQFQTKAEREYKRIFGKISGYTTTYNLEGYPFVESITSMLGFCDEVVVVDGESNDGTYEILEELAASDERIKLYQNAWDLEEPGMDGMQKAFARALCENEFLWQQDCDEVVHEDDYEKIRTITKRFPRNADIIHLPIIELWGSPNYVTGRRHAWKWRMSRNKPEITHGINAGARLTNEETGKVYAKPGMSDGCEYVNAMTNDMVNHTGFYNPMIEAARINNPEEYAKGMNYIFSQLPSIYHYSWCSLPNKVKQFTSKWDKQWNVLYQTDNIERFPGVKDEEVAALSKKLFEEGGEESDDVKYKFRLERPNPAIMREWLRNAPLEEDEKVVKIALKNQQVSQ